MNIANLTSTVLHKAADLKEQIEKLTHELANLIGSEIKAAGEIPVPFFKSKRGRKKTKFSAAGLARIRAAQKARWAKIKGVKGKKVAAKTERPVKKKRKMSAAARAKIAAAAKARWAKAKAAGKSSL